MEYMNLAELIRYGTPVILFALVILSVYQATIIRQLQKEMQDLKQGITWADVCTNRHIEIDRRLEKIEDKVFDGGV